MTLEEQIADVKRQLNTLLEEIANKQLGSDLVGGRFVRLENLLNSIEIAQEQFLGKYDNAVEELDSLNSSCYSNFKAEIERFNTFLEDKAKGLTLQTMSQLDLDYEVQDLPLVDYEVKKYEEEEIPKEIPLDAEYDIAKDLRDLYREYYSALLKFLEEERLFITHLTILMAALGDGTNSWVDKFISGQETLKEQILNYRSTLDSNVKKLISDKVAAAKSEIESIKPDMSSGQKLLKYRSILETQEVEQFEYDLIKPLDFTILGGLPKVTMNFLKDYSLKIRGGLPKGSMSPQQEYTVNTLRERLKELEEQLRKEQENKEQG